MVGSICLSHLVCAFLFVRLGRLVVLSFVLFVLSCFVCFAVCLCFSCFGCFSVFVVFCCRVCVSVGCLFCVAACVCSVLLVFSSVFFFCRFRFFSCACVCVCVCVLFVCLVDCANHLWKCILERH